MSKVTFYNRWKELTEEGVERILDDAFRAATNTDRVSLAASRGRADAYYGRLREPHLWLDGLGRDVVWYKDMTSAEIEAYGNAYDDELDRKEWGIA